MSCQMCPSQNMLPRNEKESSEKKKGQYRYAEGSCLLTARLGNIAAYQYCSGDWTPSDLIMLMMMMRRREEWSEVGELYAGCMSGQTMKMARVMNADCPPLDTDKAHRDTRPPFIVCRHYESKKIKDTSTMHTKPLSSINNPRPPALIDTSTGKLNSDDYSATCTKVATCTKSYLHTRYCNNKKSQSSNPLAEILSIVQHKVCTFNRRYLTSPTSPTVYLNPYQTLSTKTVYKAQGCLSVSSRSSAEK